MATKPKRKQCQYCLAELYPDEPGSMCQDCRGVAANIKAAHVLRLTAQEADAQAEARYEECLRKSVGT